MTRWKLKLLNGVCVLILMLHCYKSWSQNAVIQDVIGSAGGYEHEPVFGNLHWTVGEPMIETYESGWILSQGFHQTYYDLLTIVSVDGPENNALQMLLYPNPAEYELTVQLSASLPFRTIVHDAIGQVVLPEQVGNKHIVIPVRDLPAGVYFVSVSSAHFTFRAFKFIKP